jgi:hypothetical protein
LTGNLVVAVLGLGLFAAIAFAQIPPELAVTKTCPAAPVPPGSTVQCQFSIENVSDFSVINLSVTSTVPFPGGTPASVPCNQGGSPVTVLGPFGTCTGVVEETAPPCSGATTFLMDEIAVTGMGENDGTSIQMSGSGLGAVQIPACTPTPTNAPTNTPTATPVPVVPTLSSPVLALLGLVLSVVSLLLMRKGA